ncbi:prolyl oligopeptidase family serine peptidase [Simiduia curdlanivorans]|uniref:Prolyl oligopeptidase family serine peptidase n=1 Tax=Simiduia curdlanivorans TaxID=1492769 RepID=A0ABV8UZG9_9GAMM|nr:prolyl oligopeptidase family serine peptidase [Simiduia curdlanivorans]MDN3639204.1 prolyl oligopeptidase family serine peptidase [Simiduia curdlanivorans]
MTAKHTAPFGTWSSPINAQILTRQSVKLSRPLCLGKDTYWLESRPSEQGRSVIVKHSIGQMPEDVTPPQVSVRSKVNEYGGGDFCVSEAFIFYVDATDQQIYALDQHLNQIRQITHTPSSRYADLVYDPLRNRLIAIREDFPGAELESLHTLVSVDLATGQITTLAEGDSFYASPALSTDGNQLAWLSWNHPNMPWDYNQCWRAVFNQQGQLEQKKIVSPAQSSSFQPRWSSQQELFLVNDQSGWWNIYRLASNAADTTGAHYSANTLKPVLALEAEFATPQWVFGMSCYDFLNQNTLFATYTQQGQWRLASIDLTQPQPTLSHIDNGFCDISSISCAGNHSEQRAVLLAASSNQAQGVWQWHNQQWQCLKQSIVSPLESDTIACAQAISFATSHKDKAHGFYYPPTNPNYAAPAGEKPPLIVLSHGGPTGATETALNFKIQYWTSRGFAVLDVNYRGSTGYGTAYRNRLKGQWGIFDVDDVCAGAQYLVAQGLADAKRLIIKGSSAGGYTVLAALTFRDTFSAGTSLYGIGDLSALATDTHKFEARYLDSLVAPWPSGEPTYRERSPIHHVQKLTCPVIFFQGLKDKVVPPNQAEMMVAALRRQRIQTAYVSFANEGHGFREGQSIEDQLELELNFYGKIFNFPVQPTRADFQLIGEI